jgi:hypothetical protein
MFVKVTVSEATMETVQNLFPKAICAEERLVEQCGGLIARPLPKQMLNGQRNLPVAFGVVLPNAA